MSEKIRSVMYVMLDEDPPVAHQTNTNTNCYQPRSDEGLVSVLTEATSATLVSQRTVELTCRIQHSDTVLRLVTGRHFGEVP